MFFDLSSAIDVLSRTPTVLDSLLRELRERKWSELNEGRDTFSPFDVVGHLNHGERTDWLARTKIILEHGTERPFDRYDRFAQYRESEGKTMEELLDEFRDLRANNLRELRSLNLTDEQLDQQGVHPGLGEVTLRQLLAAWVIHDLGHIAQISRVMAKQLTDDAGPWIEYLAVLRDRPAPSD